MRRPYRIIAALAVVGLSFGALLWLRHKKQPTTVRIERPEVVASRKEKSKADAAFATKPVEAKARYAEFVTKHKADPDPAIHDQVGNVEIRLGYLAARQGDLEAGRKQFLEASRIKGTGAMSADFGGVPDQAAYQAIVCLVAEHKEDEAKKQFRSFIKDRPLSPLVTSAFRRLRRLNNNQIDPNDEGLLQQAIALQEKHIHFETTVCGPKTIEYLLKRNLLPRSTTVLKPTVAADGLDYKRIAELCGTTDSGTSIDGLRKCLTALGIQSYGLELNRRDFAKMPVPAIYLQYGHYLAVLAIESGKAVVYDPRYSSESTISLPPIDDPKFLATVLTFKAPVLSEEGN